MKTITGLNPFALFEALRPTQWIKNLNLFAAIILTGQLLNPDAFYQSLLAFITFCALSSSSYLVNDLIDVERDRLHPLKKYRPLARGDLSPTIALGAAIILIVFGLNLSIIVGPSFFVISLIFSLLQFSYSFFLKNKATLDIMGISLFFIIRAYAGELASGYHLPVWIMLTVIFLSLFIASGKRRSELVSTGSIKTRTALKGYGRSLLNFYTTMFAVCTLVTYAMFTFFEEKIVFDGAVHRFILKNFPQAIDRKWYMVTLLPVIYGIMRYGQVIFEMQEGERPEQVVTRDIPLMIAVLIWGLMIIAIIYAI